MFRALSVSSVAVALLTGCSTVPEGHAATEAQWETIFDGETLTGWTPKISGEVAGMDTRGTFRAADGVLSVDYTNYEGFSRTFGLLFFERELRDYRLRFEYRFRGDQLPDSPTWAFMNSGAMLHSQSAESMTLDASAPISVEAQLLGRNADLPDRTTGNVCTPGTHVVVSGELQTEHCLPSTALGALVDEWVTFEADVRGNDQIRLYINGELAFDLTEPVIDPTDGWGSQYDIEAAPLGQGYIALQSESHAIDFRNIQLLDRDPVE